jgi:iron complex transport system ATP-binding protein
MTWRDNETVTRFMREPAIEFDDVRVWAPTGEQILRDVNWHVGAGERWALIGPNGSGKSTSLALAGAARHPSSGRVRVLGGTLGQVNMPALRQSIGRVDAGAPILEWITGLDLVLTGIGSTLRPLWWQYTDADKERGRDLMAMLGCEDLEHREIKTCSQGERGRLRIARALISGPRLLLLDEPAVGLDLAAREALIAALDRLHAERPDLTSVLVTHHLEELPGSVTHALLLSRGMVVASGPVEETLNGENLSACFGLPVTCSNDGERWFARAAPEWSRAIAVPS